MSLPSLTSLKKKQFLLMHLHQSTAGKKKGVFACSDVLAIKIPLLSEFVYNYIGRNNAITAFFLCNSYTSIQEFSHNKKWDVWLCSCKDMLAHTRWILLSDRGKEMCAYSRLGVWYFVNWDFSQVWSHARRYFISLYNILRFSV